MSAEDDPGDTLTYTLGGTDATSFDIVSTTGQLQVKDDPGRRHQVVTYTVTVTATDTSNASAEIDGDHHSDHFNFDPRSRWAIVTTPTTTAEIDKEEVLDGIDDYFDTLITKEDVLDLIDLYFAG